MLCHIMSNYIMMLSHLSSQFLMNISNQFNNRFSIFFCTYLLYFIYIFHHIKSMRFSNIF